MCPSGCVHERGHVKRGTAASNPVSPYIMCPHGGCCRPVCMPRPQLTESHRTWPQRPLGYVHCPPFLHGDMLCRTLRLRPRSDNSLSSRQRMNVMTAASRCRLRAGLPLWIKVPSSLHVLTSSSINMHLSDASCRLSTLECMSTRAKWSTGPMKSKTTAMPSTARATAAVRSCPLEAEDSTSSIPIAMRGRNLWETAAPPPSPSMPLACTRPRRTQCSFHSLSACTFLVRC